MLLNEVLETFVELLVSIYLFKPNQKKKIIIGLAHCHERVSQYNKIYLFIIFLAGP